MNEKVIKSLETAVRLEESGIYFFSNAARKFYRISELKNSMETFAKSKVFNRNFFSDLLNQEKKLGLKVNDSGFESVDLSKFGVILEDISVVGENSMPVDVLNSAFNYILESARFFSSMKKTLGYSVQFDKIINENKIIFELIKKHIHNFTVEVYFYGYE